MSISPELAALFRRDLTRLVQELSAFPEGSVWSVLPPITNSAGNLALHIEGNLREYIGRQLGNVAYGRQRNLEFSLRGLAKVELLGRLEVVKELIPGIVAGLSARQLDSIYPENVLGVPLSTRQFLVALYGHLNYHLGQIDYLRRIVTQGATIEFAGL